MSGRKIVIIGAGHVGSHCAYSLASFGVCNEIVLIDVNENLAKSHAADIADGITLMDSRPVLRCGNYTDCTDADIVVVSAGVPRQPGQTRLDVMAASVAIMKDIAPKLQNSGFNGILITISNPADIIADYMKKHLNLPKNKVFSTGTGLDSARLKRILSDRYHIDRASVNAFSMGEHGDSQVIPFSSVTIGGVPLSVYDKSPDYGYILERTRMVGMDIINGKGATEFGIGTVLAKLAKAILNEDQTILPVSAFLEGQYGVSGIYAGVPCVIGRNGIEKIVELPLTSGELSAFQASAEVIQKYIELAEKL